ncbi:MAG: Mor transcription activator family protein [Methylovulum sp.]|nr:Mor transcription activator family protein [Methylovulum sp.]
MELTPAITLQELAQVDVNRLPPQARVIIRLIGIEDAWALLSHFGGKDINIPMGKRPGTLLYQAIPEASAAALINAFAGKRLALPTTDKIVRQIRDHRIHHAKAQGETTRALARRFHLTRRSIILICTRMDAEQPVKKVFKHA